MFAKEICGITLANDIADRLFDNITAASCGTDKTFAATLRAVLPGRLPAGESLNLALVPLGYNAVTPDAIADKIRQHDIGHSYTIYIVYPQDKQLGNQILDIVRPNVGEGKRYFDTYALREDLRVFYIKMLGGLFYVCGHGAIIFLDYLDMRRFHALQMMIPKYLPRLFADNPLSAEETGLLKSLGLRTHHEYERLIEQFAQRLDMRSEIIRMRLSGFETAFERIRADEIRNEINGYQNDYDSYLSYLRELSQKIQNCQYTLAGLECEINKRSGDSELMEYFMCNKNLSIIRAAGTVIEFVVHGYADIYDANAFERYAGNHNGYMYSQLNPAVTKPQMEKLYRALFGDCRYKLRLCAAYTADMRSGLKAFSHYTFPPESMAYLPNPHIQHYGCIGSYAGRFQEYMRKKDYVGAIDQAAVSARNLNFYDSAVISTFAQDLSRSTIKCIEKPDGTLLTPREAIKELEGGAECQDP